MTGLPEGSLDDMVQAVRQAKATIARNSMRRRAARESLMPEEAMEALVGEARDGG